MNYGNRSEKEVFIAKAESFLDQGLQKEAQDFALNWLERFPDDAEARVILCQAWTRMGKLDKVKQLLGEVDDAIYGMSVIYAKMGDICQRSGLNQEAITFYRKFLDLNPNSPITTEVAEKLHSLAPDGETILLQEEDTPQHSPSIMRTVTIAELYMKQGHTDLAAEILEEIIKKDDTNKRALAMLSEIGGGGTAQPEKDAPPEKGAPPDAVLKELNRWLSNLDRIRAYAA
ncbi:MAG: tetratricopeptide repeat protein [Deltaproteobacteria bacterium]|nr:tetratricopeptide repeat protein [Deltaproteobacteria bacterium]